MPFDPADLLRRYRDRIARYRFLNWTPSVHTRLDLDVGPALRYLEASGLGRTVPPVTLEHLWLCAAARVLRERPLFNTRFDGYMRMQARDDVQLRVSCAGPDGMVFGVIRNADRLDPQQMAAAHRALGRAGRPPEFVERPPRTRPGRLGRLIDDLLLSAVDYVPLLERLVGDRAGADAGSFTVLNAGAYGAEDFHAVVLRPAVGMLCVMKPKQLLVAGPDGPRFETRVPMAVPFCHKVMDTDAAGYFLWHMQQKLDDPVKFLGAPAPAPREDTVEGAGTARTDPEARRAAEGSP